MRQIFSNWKEDDPLALVLTMAMGMLGGGIVSPILCFLLGWLTIMAVPLNLVRLISLLLGLGLWIWLGTAFGTIGEFHKSGQKGAVTGWIGGYIIAMMAWFSLLIWWF